VDVLRLGCFLQTWHHNGHSTFDVRPCWHGLRIFLASDICGLMKKGDVDSFLRQYISLALLFLKLGNLVGCTIMGGCPSPNHTNIRA
jgi:hypothetical protein